MISNLTGSFEPVAPCWFFRRLSGVLLVSCHLFLLPDAPPGGVLMGACGGGEPSPSPRRAGRGAVVVAGVHPLRLCSMNESMLVNSVRHWPQMWMSAIGGACCAERGRQKWWNINLLLSSYHTCMHLTLKCFRHVWAKVLSPFCLNSNKMNSICKCTNF